MSPQVWIENLSLSSVKQRPWTRTSPGRLYANLYYSMINTKWFIISKQAENGRRGWGISNDRWLKAAKWSSDHEALAPLEWGELIARVNQSTSCKPQALYMHILNEEAVLRGCRNTVARRSQCLLTRCNELIMVRDRMETRPCSRVHYTGGKTRQNRKTALFSSLVAYVRLIHGQVAHCARNLYLNQVLETHANKFCGQPSRCMLKIYRIWQFPHCAYLSCLYSIVSLSGAFHTERLKSIILTWPARTNYFRNYKAVESSYS